MTLSTTDGSGDEEARRICLALVLILLSSIRKVRREVWMELETKCRLAGAAI